MIKNYKQKIEEFKQKTKQNYIRELNDEKSLRILLKDDFVKCIATYIALTIFNLFELHSKIGTVISVQLLISIFFVYQYEWYLKKSYKNVDLKRIIEKINWAKRILIVSTILAFPILIDQLAVVLLNLNETPLKLELIGTLDFSEGIKISEFINICVTFLSTIIMGYVAFNTYIITKQQFILVEELQNSKPKLKIIKKDDYIKVKFSYKSIKFLYEDMLNEKIADYLNNESQLMKLSTSKEIEVDFILDSELFLVSDTENKNILVRDVLFSTDNNITIRTPLDYEYMNYNKDNAIAIIRADSLERCSYKIMFSKDVSLKSRLGYSIEFFSESEKYNIQYEVNLISCVNQIKDNIYNCIMKMNNDSLIGRGYVKIERSDFTKMTFRDLFDMNSSQEFIANVKIQ